MMEFTSGWLLPLIYGLGFLMLLCRSGQPWQIARLTAFTALAATLVITLATVIWPQWLALSTDALGMTLAVLVAILGWVIINYSSRYLGAEQNQARFVRAMLATLAAVGVLVVSRNLAVIVLAWTATSLSMHHLLTFYRERKAAQVAAHKKFLVSRMAEVCLVVALVLVYQTIGTLQLPGINAYLNGLSILPTSLHVAALLFALAAILKTAQLPLHGWLIQVMEAPTPVSALLHAGVVNIGGFVLIRLAELISLAPASQLVLVVVGSLTAVLAALVMLTRISIKVNLAWSTCAQMGFMLMEIGLGMYELALLHLVAHSLYKAHAFLSAGETVQNARNNDLLGPVRSANTPFWHLSAVGISGVVVIGSYWLWQQFLPALTVPPVALIIVALGLASLLWLEQQRLLGLLHGIVRVFTLCQLYLLWHLFFAALSPTSAAPSALLVAWVLLCFGLLYVTQAWLLCHPKGRFAQAVYPWAYCGFYLDETFTRLTFKLWPVKLSPLQAQTVTIRNSVTQGELL